MAEEERSREERGVEAIVALQAMVGIAETREQAKVGWDSMSEGEQDFTLSLAGL